MNVHAVGLPKICFIIAQDVINLCVFCVRPQDVCDLPIFCNSTSTGHRYHSSFVEPWYSTGLHMPQLAVYFSSHNLFVFVVSRGLDTDIADDSTHGFHSRNDMSHPKLQTEYRRRFSSHQIIYTLINVGLRSTVHMTQLMHSRLQIARGIQSRKLQA